MKYPFEKKKGFVLLLSLAILTVVCLATFSIATAADPAEFDDFGYQTLSALDLAENDGTDLRFLFTVGKLDYNEVGFVFSKSNDTPTVGGDACYKAGTTTVYRSITADGKTRAASDGRYWVAVKMTGIPHDYFDGSLYVRAFVRDGSGTRYSDAASLTVCTAAGHTHVVNEQAQKMVGGTAAMNVTGTKIGHCDGCDLDGVTQYGATTSPAYKKWTDGGSADSFTDARQMSTVLAGGKHFYPDESNGGVGNDLYVEYSVLWNETLLDFSPTANGGARVESCFSVSESGTESSRAFVRWGLPEGGSTVNAKYPGAFEYASSQIKTSEAENPYPKMISNGGYYSDYPNVAGSDRLHPEWGWHRVGIVYHEEVTNLDAVRDGSNANYKLTVSIYLDGELVSVLSGNNLYVGENKYLLYTVSSDGAGGLNYADISGDVWLQSFGLNGYQAAGGDVYFVAGDVFVTCGRDFVHPVTRIDNPAARTETVDGHAFNGAFYYTTVGTHDHVWAGERATDASAFADCSHAATQSIHCTLCGATQPASSVNLALDPDAHVFGDYEVYRYPTLLGDGVERLCCVSCGEVSDERDGEAYAGPQKTTFTEDSTERYENKKLLSEIQGEKHFYPTAGNPTGNDLLVEFSVLWNETLLNLDPGEDEGEGAFITARMAAWTNGTRNNLVYWSPTNNVADAMCKYAGGFEAPYGMEIADAGAAYTPEGMYNWGVYYEDYPNIGGAVSADLYDLENGHEWGWHHVQIRFHQELTNANNVKKGAPAEYDFVVTTYFDGVAVSMLHGTAWNTDNYLFFAESDGEGGIRYSDNPKLSGDDTEKRAVYAVWFNENTTYSDEAYWEISDVFYTCGHDFAMQIEKVESPSYVAYEIADGYDVNGAIYFRYAD